MRILITSIILILNLTLQSTLFQFIQIRGVKPNTVVALIISIAVLRGSLEGAIVGFFAGLLQDIFFSDSLGLLPLFGMLLGYFCGKPTRNFFRENYAIPFILCIIGTFCYGCLFYVTNFLFRGRVNFYYYLNNLILPEVVYTTICIVLIYKLLYIINSKIEAREYEKRKLF